MKNFFLIFYNILFNRELVLINSPLQFINFIEFKNYKNKINEKIYCRYVFLGYLNDKEINIINYLNKKINSSSALIIPFKKNINIYILHFLIKVKKLFLKKYNQVVIGDYNYYLFKEFYKISNSRILLDDGTNSLEFEKSFKLDKKNLIIFTFFDKKIYQHASIIENKFLHLKDFLRKKYKKKVKKIGYFIGSPYVELEILTRDQYYFYIKDIISKNKNIDFIYVPHAREISSNYTKYNFKKILESKYNFELFLINSSFYPIMIVGGYSTLFITIKNIFNNKLSLKSYSFSVKYRKRAPRYDVCSSRLRLINNYINKNSNISNKIVINT
jgi:hypothetical protein